MKSKDELKKEIFEKVIELYNLKKEDEEFIPGESTVNYAGRVFDEKEIIKLVDSSLDFWLTAGKYANQFEKELANFLGTRYCLLTNSGSSANLLAISALTSPKLGEKQLKPGDEVITTSCGFPTTLNPIIQNNLKPLFIDVQKGNYNIQADKIEDALSENTKAMFIPHTLGNPAEIDKIMQISKEYKLWFVEDNCDALGSMYNGKYTGSYGHISTFSFYPAHHITMGEGGALATNNPLLKDIIASFRDWGRDCWCEPGCDNTCRKRFNWQLGDLPAGYDHKYMYSHIGYNLKVTDMQAAIGVEQLKKLPEFIEARKKNFNTLYDSLKPYEEYLILPKWDTNSEPSWFGFPILVKDSAPFTRDDMVNYLENNKIATRMLFGGNLIRQPAYQNIQFRQIDSLENSDLVMNNLFWIGVYPGIDDRKMNYVIQVLNNFLNATVKSKSEKIAI
ncbi:lipopolysaccharide biosynthesis protein RfbH [Methanobacterium oryzae]|uniref:lipopolysaccharide biosynthesis protein RfbH n=1 Tax=Methanobacterium oryzae TaxID=69540 RepID=UPI003D2101F4